MKITNLAKISYYLLRNYLEQSIVRLYYCHLKKMKSSVGTKNLVVCSNNNNNNNSASIFFRNLPKRSFTCRKSDTIQTSNLLSDRLRSILPNYNPTTPSSRGHLLSTRRRAEQLCSFSPGDLDQYPD